MTYINHTFIPIQYTRIEPLYVLNSPDIIGLYHESHSHQCNSQRGDPSCNRKES